MGVLVREEAGQVWLRINHKGVRKSKLVGPASKATLKAAEQAAERLRAELVLHGTEAITTPEPEKNGHQAASPLLKTVCAEWLDWHQKNYPRRESTQGNYRSFIDARLIPALGDRRVSTITRAVLQDWIAEAQTTPCQKSGKVVAYTTLVSHYVPCFKKVLDFAVERGWLAANPFRTGGRLFEASDADREAAPAPNPFTPTELNKVLEAARQIDPDLELFLRTWSQCGARSGEVRGLLVKDLALSKGTITINKTLHHKAGRTWTGPTKRPKRSNRVASLLYGNATDRPAEALLKRLTAHVRGKDASAPLFEKPSGGAITEGSLHWRWERCLHLAGVEYREAEQLRHTFISLALSRGENPLKVARQTGHTVPVLLTHYASWIPEAEGEPIRKHAASSRLHAV